MSCNPDPAPPRPSKPGGSDFWTPEREALLRQTYARGDSFAVIARTVGDGCTRNQALGKVYRLGLPKRGAKSAVSRANARAGKPRAGPPRPPRLRLVGEGRAGMPEAPGLATLLTLTPTMCRWPIGDPESPGFTFCGQRRAPGRPYCRACLDARRPYLPLDAGLAVFERAVRRLVR